MRAERLHHVRLAGETDLAGFRQAARALLLEGVPPEAVGWSTGDGQSLAGFEEAPPETPAQLAAEAGARRHPEPAPRVPAAFVELCAAVALHADADRHALLYRLLWRLVHEPALRHDALDADRLRAERMAREVGREIHKMHAFVRFRPIAAGEDGEAVHVAWFEPRHHVVEAAAPFFARRFANLRWAILTPERSVRWSGKRLEFGPGAEASAAPPPDAGEALWLTYYDSIFNPARLKLATMARHMPRRYWPNMPEAERIAPLAAQAAERSAQMLARPATQPARKRPQAAQLKVQPSRSAAAQGAEGVPTPAAEGHATLDQLRVATDRCRECPIGEFATQSVFGEGPPGAKLMLVGEQPGDQEDLRGRPFVGPAGQLLDRAMAELGWPRETLYVTNAVKHFKFELRGKRRLHKTPTQREAAACAHWLEAEIERVQPQALVALGATAARSLLGRQVAVLSERGQWLPGRADGRPVLVTLHPSALLRMQPEERDAAYARWLEDLALASAQAKASG